MNLSNPADAEATGVVVTGGGSPNALGVVRGFGRRGVPVFYIDSEPRSFARHSRYVHQRVRPHGANGSEAGLIDTLLDLGRRTNHKMVVIPTGDKAVLSLSRHKEELESHYHVPVASCETVEQLVDKKKFYRLLAAKGIPHPKTYFPYGLAEVRSIGRGMPYPYLVKPADSSSFQEAFGRKNFLIESADDLEEATARLRGRDLEVMIQDIVPGREIYSFYAYYDRDSEPLTLCGYDKIRQYEPDLGSGSFCKSIWRPEAARTAFRLLREMSYHGFAEPELKKDPRDGQYKLLEINARTTLQNRLPAACGVDIEYAAYLDCLGTKPDPSVRPRSGVLWVDDFADQKSFLIHLKRRDLSRSEIADSLKLRKVHSVAAWDDPLPFVVRVARALWAGFRRVLPRWTVKTAMDDR